LDLRGRGRSVANTLIAVIGIALCHPARADRIVVKLQASVGHAYARAWHAASRLMCACGNQRSSRGA